MDDVVNLVAATDHENDLKSLVTDILRRAHESGADAAEVSASEDAGLSVTVRLGELENVEFNRDRGFGITVYFGKRKGSASTSDSTPEAVAATVRAACNIARFTEDDPCHGLADASLMARVFPDLDLDHPWTTTRRRRRSRSRRRPKRPRGVTIGESRTPTARRSARSASVASTATATVSSVVTSAPDTASVAASLRMTATAWSATTTTRWVVRSTISTMQASVGVEAARRAVARLGARPVKTGRYPCLFSAEVARV